MNEIAGQISANLGARNLKSHTGERPTPTNANQRHFAANQHRLTADQRHLQTGRRRPARPATSAAGAARLGRVGRCCQQGRWWLRPRRHGTRTSTAAGSAFPLSFHVTVTAVSSLPFLHLPFRGLSLPFSTATRCGQHEKMGFQGADPASQVHPQHLMLASVSVRVCWCVLCVLCVYVRVCVLCVGCCVVCAMSKFGSLRC